MRKLTKTAAIVASMAVMAMGATIMTSAATEGWVQSGSNWYYYSKGDRVSNQWVLAGNDWYFLDDEGRMVKNTFVRIDKFNGESEVLDSRDIHDELGKDDIDDDSEFYFLGNDGKMVKGWKEMSASSIYASPNSGSSTKVWYYFADSGRMYVNEWVESNGKWYALSPNGQMYAEAAVNNDLIDWNSDDFFYMNSDGAMVTGWYKTKEKTAGSDAKVSDDAYLFFNGKDGKKDKWVYGDPDTGILADEEWKKIDNKWYYFGTDARTSKDGVNDDYLNVYIAKFDLDDLSEENHTVVSSAATYLTERELTNTEKYEADPGINGEQDADAMAKFAMLSEKIIAWANHKSNNNDEEINYFYLNKDGDALTTWKEIDDDIYICGNDKGELYRDEIGRVGGKYYYFNADGICNYKYLNNTADYAVVIAGKDGYEANKTLGDSKYELVNLKFYETTRERDSLDYGEDLEYKKLADIKDDLDDLGVESVNFGSRKVKVRSLTESEALLAWAMVEELCKKEGISTDKDKIEKNALITRFGKEEKKVGEDEDYKLSIYKLRTSSSIEKKSVTFNLK